MNTEEVESLCVTLSLEGNKEPVAELDGELQLASCRKLDLSVVGRLLATRKINHEAFRAIIMKIWHTTQEVEIEVLRDNIFRFHFSNMIDRKRVLAGGPWTFDGSLLVLEESKDVGILGCFWVSK
ncbi:hypothetical protein ACOSQ4_023607 [Xanthoceras sorbifolium]